MINLHEKKNIFEIDSGTATKGQLSTTAASIQQPLFWYPKLEFSFISNLFTTSILLQKPDLFVHKGGCDREVAQYAQCSSIMHMENIGMQESTLLGYFVVGLGWVREWGLEAEKRINFSELCRFKKLISSYSVLFLTNVSMHWINLSWGALWSNLPHFPVLYSKIHSFQSSG